MTSPTPMVIIGKGEQIIDAVVVILKPEFHVLRSFTEIAPAQEYIVSTMSSPSINVPQPSIILMGGGFPPSDYEMLQSGLETLLPGIKERVAWLRPDFSKTPPPGPPSAEMISKRVRTGVDQVLGELTGDVVGRGKLFHY